MITETSPKDFGTILFVDDDETILKLGREILNSFGYSIIACATGEEALEIFQREPGSFHALVTDHCMPGITGKELIQSCLKIRPELTAVLCSGYADQIDEEDRQHIGYTCFIPKPVDWKKLAQTLQKGKQT